MSYGEWLDESAQRRVERAVKELELVSSAEVVVTVRQTSGSYRAADVMFGALLAFAGLVVYVYHPFEFTDDLVPPALLILFLAGSFFCSQVGPLRRLLTPQRLLSDNARRAALTEFHEQRISVTRDRTGIFVYVSLFERIVEIVPDVGVGARRLGDDGTAALAAMRDAVRQGGVETLVEGLGRLARALERSLPRSSDDVNELPDAVVS